MRQPAVAWSVGPLTSPRGSAGDLPVSGRTSCVLRRAGSPCLPACRCSPCVWTPVLAEPLPVPVPGGPVWPRARRGPGRPQRL